MSLDMANRHRPFSGARVLLWLSSMGLLICFVLVIIMCVSQHLQRCANSCLAFIKKSKKFSFDGMEKNKSIHERPPLLKSKNSQLFQIPGVVVEEVEIQPRDAMNECQFLGDDSALQASDYNASSTLSPLTVYSDPESEDDLNSSLTSNSNLLLGLNQLQTMDATESEGQNERQALNMKVEGPIGSKHTLNIGDNSLCRDGSSPVMGTRHSPLLSRKGVAFATNTIADHESRDREGRSSMSRSKSEYLEAEKGDKKKTIDKSSWRSRSVDNRESRAKQPIRLQPNLYSKRKVTMGVNILGKIDIQLYYEDKARSTLVLTLKRIRGMYYSIGDVYSVYVDVMLPPERKPLMTCQTKKARACDPVFDEKFVFHARNNLKFASRTFVLNVMCVGRSDKDITCFGQSRVSLLDMEIYSNMVPIDEYVGIQPVIPLHREIGDAFISLAYCDEKGDLLVGVKQVRFPEQTFLDRASMLVVTASVIRHGNSSPFSTVKRRRRCTTAIIDTPTCVVNFDGALLTLKLPSEQIWTTTLKLSVSVRHRTLHTKNKLGRVLIGNSHGVLREGSIHWTAVVNSHNSDSYMWHPIFCK